MQVCLVADGVGALLCFDILCRTSDSGRPMHRRGSGSTLVEATHLDSLHSASAAAGGNTSQQSSDADVLVDQFEFDVSEFFMLGSPVALVLAYRQLCSEQHYSGQLSTTVHVGAEKNAFATVNGRAAILLPITSPMSTDCQKSFSL